MKQKSINKRTIIYCGIALLLLIFVVPYLGVIYYTMPRNDEFSAAFGVAFYGGYSFRNVCRWVAHEYINWEGNYSGVFLYTLLNPLVLGDIDITVKAMNIVCFLFFCVAWSYIIYRILSFFDIEKMNKQLLTVITFTLSINCRFMRETLGWYTGYMYYTIQFLLGMIGMFMVWNIIENKPAKTWKTAVVMVISCVFEIVGAGGTLHVSAILCFVILLFLLWILYSKKEWIKAAILFTSIFAATLVNLLAPGHSVRKDGYEETSVIKGAIYTFICVYREFKRLCTETYIPYVLLLIFVVLFWMIKGYRKNIALHPAITFSAGVCCIVGSTFPVCYGYGDSTLGPRGYEIMDMLFVIWAVIFISSVVNYLKGKNYSLDKNNLLILTVITVFFFCSYSIAHIEISDIPSIQCTSGLLSGDIRDYSEYWFDILHQVEDADGGDVVIYVDREYLEEECMIDRCLFQEDPTNWVNNAAAVYYGYNSVRIECKE